MNSFDIGNINIKKIFLYSLILFFAYSVSGVVFMVLAERTIGSVARGIMPTLPILFLIVLFTLYDTRRLSFTSLLPRIPSNISIKLIIKRLFSTLIIAIPFGLIVIKFFSQHAILYTPIIIFTLSALGLSIYYTIRGNLLNATAIFIITIPLLMFLSREIFWGSGFTTYYSNVFSGAVLMALSGHYLLIMFIFYLISKNQVETQHRIAREPIIKLTYFIIIYSLFSVLMSKDILFSFFYYLMEIIAPIVFFILLMKAISNIKDIIFLFKIMTICVFLYCFFGIYFIFLGQAEEVFATGIHSFATTGEFMSSSYLGLITAFGAILSFVNFNISKKVTLKTVFIILTILFITITILNNARSSQIGLFAGMGYLFVVSNLRITKKVYTTILIGVIVLVLYLVFFERIASALYQVRTIETIKDILAGDPLKYLLYYRYSIWTEAVEMIWDHPFFGIGAGMWKEFTFLYGEQLYTYKDIHGEWKWRSSSDPHNQFLIFAVHYGIPTFLSFCTILFLTFKKAFLLMKKITHPSKNILHAAISGLILWFIMSLFTRTFFGMVLFIVVLFFGFLLSS